MNKKRLSFFSFSCLLFCLLTLGISSGAVLAQELTPTPTLEPLFKTPTLAPTQSTQCPLVTPQGWKTVTPSILWIAQCSNCMSSLTPQITNTAYAVSTFFAPMSQTAQASITPSATGSPTNTPYASPTGTPSLGRLTLQSVQYQGGGVGQGTPTRNYSCSKAMGSAGLSSFYCSGSSSFPDTVNGFDVWDDIKVNFAIAVPVNETFYYRWTQSGDFLPGYPKMDYIAGGAIQTMTQTSGSFVYNTTYDFNLTMTYRMGETNKPIGYVASGNWYFEISHYPLYATPSAPTPTVTLTPTPIVSYCSSVNGTTSNAADTSDLPNIKLGPSTCANFGPYTISLSSLNWLPGVNFTDIALPAVNICFREIYFGFIKIFGLQFDLDILSAVLTGIVALRWLFRS